MIGRYKLHQQLGEGGMGVVYMAEQEEPVRRRVALKIIKSSDQPGRILTRVSLINAVSYNDRKLIYDS